MLATLFAAGVLDQDAPHSLGGRSEEVAAVLPAGIPLSHQPEVRLVNQGRGLERLTGLLLRHPLRRQLA
jgi:hypothetical protein